jgi:hypothetical protein
MWHFRFRYCFQSPFGCLTLSVMNLINFRSPCIMKFYIFSTLTQEYFPSTSPPILSYCKHLNCFYRMQLVKSIATSVVYCFFIHVIELSQERSPFYFIRFLCYARVAVCIGKFANQHKVLLIFFSAISFHSLSHSHIVQKPHSLCKTTKIKPNKNPSIFFCASDFFFCGKIGLYSLGVQNSFFSVGKRPHSNETF